MIVRPDNIVLQGTSEQIVDTDSVVARKPQPSHCHQFVTSPIGEVSSFLTNLHDPMVIGAEERDTVRFPSGKYIDIVCNGKAMENSEYNGNALRVRCIGANQRRG